MSTIFDSAATTTSWSNFWSSAATDITSFNYFLMSDPYLYEWHFQTNSNGDLFATEKSIHGYARGKLRQPHIIGKIKPQPRIYGARKIRMSPRGFETERQR